MKVEVLKEKIKKLPDIKVKEIYNNYKQEVCMLMDNEEIESNYPNYVSYMNVPANARKVYGALLNDYLDEQDKLKQLKETDMHAYVMYLHGSSENYLANKEKDITECLNKIAKLKVEMEEMELKNPNLRYAILTHGKNSGTLKYVYDMRVKLAIIRKELSLRQANRKKGIN